jgi:drug/metabolite transporter (DMT)-like permease
MAGGVAALYNALSTRPAKPDGIWLGTTALWCGGVFLYITLGAGQWSDLSTSWPVFPAIAGLAWAVSWLADTRQVSNLVTGLVALCVGALGFLYTSGRLEAARGVAIAQLWPVILVVLGAGLIVQYLVQRKR